MSFRAKAFSLIFYVISRFLYKTLRLQIIGEDKIESMRQRHGGVLLATWHGRTLIPIVSFAGKGYWALVSTSRDGEYQNNLLTYYGFRTVRGSTSSRGAVTAALKMAKTLNKGNVLAITPDGPRGPIHSIQPGTIFIAEKSGCPILPFATSAHPRKLVSTWDRYLLPGIGANAVVIYGDPMMIPPNLDEAQREAYGQVLAQRLQNLEDQAEEIVRCRSDKRSAQVY